MHSDRHLLLTRFFSSLNSTFAHHHIFPSRHLLCFFSASLPPLVPLAHSGRRMVDLAGGIPGRVIWLWCNVNHIARDFQPAGAESVRPQHLKTPTLAEVTTPEPAVCWTVYALINSSAIRFRLQQDIWPFHHRICFKIQMTLFLYQV